MRNGFTKIPNSILDLPWGNNPTVVYLYTWLSLHADKDGMVRMSLNEISSKTGLNKMQVRRAIEKMKVTQVVTQVATQVATQLPNTLTICYLSTCKGVKPKSDIASDIASDTGSDTARAYKNDYINIMSKQDDIKTTPYNPPRGYERFDFSFVDDSFKPIVFEWLQYKIDRKEKKYAEKGLKMFYTKLQKLSNNDVDTAKKIVEQSYANNWAGIFELKENKPSEFEMTQLRNNDDKHKYDGGFW